MLESAYGMADLEHGVANRPDTIFEAGSVSKQFTAAAVLLLAEDGKLSLDDPVRKYIPELPDYAASITIRQMLHHTSGLRDWGNVAWIGGWPRGTRVHTHDHVLDILSRQEALNFAPGTRWSYSNSGYNLSAILVSRVAGESFADFTRKRIFEPLGMTRTSWRDDYTRIVKDRAVAYAKVDDRYATDMPFENMYGNGGLLTTVGDLLRWNENFAVPKVGGPDFARTMQTPGRLAGGEETGYGFGLGVGRYKGLQEFRHSGTTASYRAFLARFPEPQVSIAVLCNAGDSMPRETLHAVADLFLAGALRPDPAIKAVSMSAAELDALAGLYRNIDRGDVVRIEREGSSLRLGDGTPLVALSATALDGRRRHLPRVRWRRPRLDGRRGRRAGRARAGAGRDTDRHRARSACGQLRERRGGNGFRRARTGRHARALAAPRDRVPTHSALRRCIRKRSRHDHLPAQQRR